MRLLRAVVALAGLALVVVGCSSPTEPGSASAPPLKSIRYVRTYPVRFPPSQPGVYLNYIVPYVRDPYHRSAISLVPLRALDATTFVYDHPENFMELPVDTQCSFFVTDTEVSAHPVAKDIFVNGTRLRVETIINATDGLPDEYGRFKIDKSGRVY